MISSSLTFSKFVLLSFKRKKRRRGRSTNISILFIHYLESIHEYSIKIKMTNIKMFKVLNLIQVFVFLVSLNSNNVVVCPPPRNIETTTVYDDRIHHSANDTIENDPVNIKFYIQLLILNLLNLFF
jgi:hypothetical protein